MAIQLINKTRFKERFRLVDNPKIVVLALLHEPPEEIRYANNLVIRMLEISHTAVSVEGKQIQDTGRSGAIFLVGSFLRLRDSKTYRAYEASHLGQDWSRQGEKVHPVTGLKTSTDKYSLIKKINITVLHSSSLMRQDMNPTQGATIISTDELLPADIVGEFLIRETHKEYGLYFCQAEYKTVEPNG